MSRPAVLASGRRLADVARPAGGRPLTRHVCFQPVGWALAEPTAHLLIAALATEVGPARVGGVVVEAWHNHEDAAAALRHPRFAHLSAERLTITLAGYDAALATLGHAVLLIAHCLVLWPQTESTRRWPQS